MKRTIIVLTSMALLLSLIPYNELSYSERLLISLFIAFQGFIIVAAIILIIIFLAWMAES